MLDWAKKAHIRVSHREGCTDKTVKPWAHYACGNRSFAPVHWIYIIWFHAIIHCCSREMYIGRIHRVVDRAAVPINHCICYLAFLPTKYVILCDWKFIRQIAYTRETICWLLVYGFAILPQKFHETQIAVSFIKRSYKPNHFAWIIIISVECHFILYICLAHSTRFEEPQNGGEKKYI